MLVESNDEAAVLWTKPEEWIPNERDPFRGLAQQNRDGFLVVFVDGYIHRFSPTLNVETFRRMLSRDDGQSIDFVRDKP